ncbi:MAG: taurine ABC transporter substrate-binding protein, partial [Boseongicola sp.]|nr:taurine ABC transporter substrate-binding protein [Boseongicola sp.]
VTAEANATWNAGGADAEAMIPVIAKDAGMDEEATAQTLATFSFPSIDSQLSEAWLGGTAQGFMKGVADVFVNAGSIDGALDSYAPAVNTGPLAAAQAM